jgi:hypothetical protein
MEPRCDLDKFRLREIERRLAAELQSASQRLRLALTEEDKRQALEAQHNALQRFTNFAAKGIVPQDLLPT